MTTLLAVIGDRLGLFKNLAERGPATAPELVERTKLNERCTREWLGGMAAAAYLEYDPTTGRFTLLAEHIAALAPENGPFFFGKALALPLVWSHASRSISGPAETGSLRFPPC